MPMPKPKSGEKKKDFLNRCMADDVMNDDYPDNKQRYAICNTQWDENKSLTAHSQSKGGNQSEGVESKEAPMKKKKEAVLEVREIKLEELTVRGGEGDPVRIQGIAAVFDTLSEDLGGFREKIAKGAFKKAIRKSDTRMLFNHDRNFVIGRKSAKTLRMKESDEGLEVRATLPETSWAQDLAVSMKRGDIDQMSFAFVAAKDRWEEDKKHGAVRILLEIEKLSDVSIVTYPAYTDTTVAVRSLEEWQKANEPEEDETVEGTGEQEFTGKKIKQYRRQLKLREKEHQK